MNVIVLSDFSPVSAAPVDGAFLFPARRIAGMCVWPGVLRAHRRGALVAKKGPPSRCGGPSPRAHEKQAWGGKGIDRIFFQCGTPRPVPGVLT